MIKRTLHIGSRSSPLALRQAHIVCDALQPFLPSGWTTTIIPIISSGDKLLHHSLADKGGKRLFVKELEEALLDDRIDLAVHSMKDMECDYPEGLTLGCVLQRADARDVFISPHGSLMDLPEGALVGTASVRRVAQMKQMRPDLQHCLLRGNVQQRLEKIRNGLPHATFLAAAGLARLDLLESLQPELLEIEQFLPAVGQGAIGVEHRLADTEMAELLRNINHNKSWLAVCAERAMLKQLGGSCRTPIAGHAVFVDTVLHLHGALYGLDGGAYSGQSCTHAMQANVGTTTDAEQLGEMLGTFLYKQAGHLLHG